MLITIQMLIIIIIIITEKVNSYTVTHIVFTVTRISNGKDKSG